MASDSAPDVQGDPWRITHSAFADMLPDRPAQVTFLGDSIRLEAQCNIYMNRVQMGGGAIVVFPFENMPKTCGYEVMEVEGAMLRAFQRAVSYAIDGSGDLVLSAADGAMMIRAAR